MIGPLNSNLSKKGGLTMVLLLLSKHAAAFAPAARSITRSAQAMKRTASHAHTIQASSTRIANPFVPSTKLFMSTETDTDSDLAGIEAQVKAKGDEIRDLKADGTDKAGLAPHIEELLALKAKSTAAVEALIESKGNEIRKLKEEGIDKEALAPHIEELLALKAKIAPPPAKKKEKKKQPAKQKKQKQPPKKKESDMSESELRQTRLAKVEIMREAGAEPFEYTYSPTHTSMELQELYEGKLEGGEEDEDADVAVAGRIMAKRVFGKLAFFTLQDESGNIQLHLEKNRLGDSFKVRTLNMSFTLVFISSVLITDFCEFYSFFYAKLGFKSMD
jgi:hypothetical protein